MPSALARVRRTLRRRWRRVRYDRRTPGVARTITRAVLLLLGLGLAWIVVTGLVAKQELGRLEGRIAAIRNLVADGRIADARALARQLPALAVHVHQLTSGPAWWVAAHVPVVGSPADVVRGTTLAVDRVGTDVVPKLLDVATQVDPAALRSAGDTVRIDNLARSAPRLEEAVAALARAGAEVDRLPYSTWLGVVDDYRVRFAQELAAIRGYVDAAARVADVLPPMLGQDRPQRFFIGLQNEAELRGTGGLPGAFAIATVTHGVIHFDRFESDAALMPHNRLQQISTGLDFGTQYDALYGPSLPTTTFADSNVSPDFRYAAQVWATMWERTAKQHIDSVIALDPTALANFLAVTGPVSVGKGLGVVTADNVVALTQRDNYVLFNDNTARKNYLVAILRAVARRVISGAGNPVQLVRAASASAGEQRLLVWNRDPGLEARIRETGYSGTLPSGSPPFSGVVLNNAAAGKLDYYLRRALTYARTGCGPTRDVVATIELTNTAPATGLPPYVTDRLDSPPPGARPGDTHLVLDYYATKGALLESVTVNRQRATAAVQDVSGFTVARLDVELPRGRTQRVVLHFTEPAGRGAPIVWRQPGVVPIAVQTFSQACG